MMTLKAHPEIRVLRQVRLHYTAGDNIVATVVRSSARPGVIDVVDMIGPDEALLDYLFPRAVALLPEKVAA